MELFIFLLDLPDLTSLQNRCLMFLCNNKQQYSSSTLQLLPKHIQRKMDLVHDVMSLSQLSVGKWAGDRVILTGCESEFSPFPPDGEWKSGNLTDNPPFSTSDVSQLIDNWATILNKLAVYYNIHHWQWRELDRDCNTDWKVVNLDKKEYLDPNAYGVDTIFRQSSRRYRLEEPNVMLGLIIKL